MPPTQKAAPDRELLAAERRARAELDALRGGAVDRRRQILVVVAAVAAISGVLAAVVTGRGPSDDDFVRAAAARVTVLLSATPDQPDRATRILSGATGEFHDEFAQSADAYTTFVRAAGTTSDGRVQGAGLTGRRGPEAEVLVFATVDLGASPQAAARSTDFRLRVIVADEAGVFKLAKVQYLP